MLVIGSKQVLSEHVARLAIGPGKKKTSFAWILGLCSRERDHIVVLFSARDASSHVVSQVGQIMDQVFGARS